MGAQDDRVVSHPRDAAGWGVRRGIAAFNHPLAARCARYGMKKHTKIGSYRGQDHDKHVINKWFKRWQQIYEHLKR
jgi:hypothetical protein